MPVTKHAVRRLKERYQKEYSEEELEQLVSECVANTPVGLRAGGKKKHISVIFQGDLIKVIFDPGTNTVVTVYPLQDLKPKITK